MKGIQNIPCGRKGPIIGLLIAALNFVNIKKRQGEVCQETDNKLVLSAHTKHYSFNFIIIWVL